MKVLVMRYCVLIYSIVSSTVSLQKSSKNEILSEGERTKTTRYSKLLSISYKGETNENTDDKIQSRVYHQNSFQEPKMCDSCNTQPWIPVVKFSQRAPKEIIYQQEYDSSSDYKLNMYLSPPPIPSASNYFQKNLHNNFEKLKTKPHETPCDLHKKHQDSLGSGSEYINSIENDNVYNKNNLGNSNKFFQYLTVVKHPDSHIQKNVTTFIEPPTRYKYLLPYDPRSLIGKTKVYSQEPRIFLNYTQSTSRQNFLSQTTQIYQNYRDHVKYTSNEPNYPIVKTTYHNNYIPISIKHAPSLQITTTPLTNLYFPNDEIFRENSIQTDHAHSISNINPPQYLFIQPTTENNIPPEYLKPPNLDQFEYPDLQNYDYNNDLDTINEFGEIKQHIDFESKKKKLFSDGRKDKMFAKNNNHIYNLQNQLKYLEDTKWPCFLMNFIKYLKKSKKGQHVRMSHKCNPLDLQKFIVEQSNQGTESTRNPDIIQEHTEQIIQEYTPDITHEHTSHIIQEPKPQIVQEQSSQWMDFTHKPEIIQKHTPQIIQEYESEMINKYTPYIVPETQIIQEYKSEILDEHKPQVIQEQNTQVTPEYEQIPMNEQIKYEDYTTTENPVKTEYELIKLAPHLNSIIPNSENLEYYSSVAQKAVNQYIMQNIGERDNKKNQNTLTTTTTQSNKEFHVNMINDLYENEQNTESYGKDKIFHSTTHNYASISIIEPDKNIEDKYQNLAINNFDDNILSKNSNPTETNKTSFFSNNDEHQYSKENKVNKTQIIEEYNTQLITTVGTNLSLEQTNEIPYNYSSNKEHEETFSEPKAIYYPKGFSYINDQSDFITEKPILLTAPKKIRIVIPYRKRSHNTVTQASDDDFQNSINTWTAHKYSNHKHSPMDTNHSKPLNSLQKSKPIPILYFSSNSSLQDNISQGNEQSNISEKVTKTWEDMAVAISPYSKERVYVVTPKSN